VSDREYIDFVDEGLDLLKDLVCDFEVSVGRPKKGEDSPTLSDLSNAWNCPRSTMSEWRLVSKFYPTDARTFDPDIITWTHYNLARKSSEGDLCNALELLEHAQEQHMATRAFERYLDGIYFEGVFRRSDLPEWLRDQIPDDVLWVTVQRNKEE
jgi:hypothetical protein